VRPLFPFYGSKWREARYYPKPGGHVVEPFAGSAGYSTFWEPERVTLIDADPIIVGVWDYLIHATSTEIMQLPDLEVGQSVDDLRLPQEARWLIGFWLNRGSATPKKTKTAYSARTDRAQLTWSERARWRIARDRQLVQHWTVREGDYVWAPEANTYFVDPPYVDKGRYYRVNTVNHEALGKWVRDLSGQVIVCEQAGADWLPFEPFRETKSSKGTSKEVVWMSRSPSEDVSEDGLGLEVEAGGTPDGDP
jgi:hypothetical protein